LLWHSSTETTLPQLARPQIQLKGAKTNESGERLQIHNGVRSEFITVAGRAPRIL
jgi:hypothetical protein